jgi:hypothetical protein
MSRWRRASCWLLVVAGLGLATEARCAGTQRKAPLRILLLASAPTREYQLVKRLFTRAADKKQVELHFDFQRLPGSKKPRPVDRADARRALDHFPDHRGDLARDRPAARPYNLASYDVVIGFDPDWLQLKPGERELLHHWVEKGGGLVLVAGPVNTGELDTAKNRKALQPITTLYPVLPSEKAQSGGSAQPHRLHFSAGKEPAFLKLDPDGKGPLAGWEEFFRGGKRGRKEDKVPQFGFYDCFPAREVRSGATVLATLADPAHRLPNGKEMPFLAVMPVERGRVVYLGSGVWRLRSYREAFHDRFWTQLVQYAAGRE